MMKKLQIVLSVALLAAVNFIYAQNSDYLLIVGKDTISKDEFLRTYQKNSSLEKATQKDLRDYLDLYTNFKLKVLDGEAQQVDTSANFTRELNSYRNQSAQQYLIDKEVTDELIEEAFEHSKYHVRASHILVECKTTNPSDTLAAYKKIMDIRKKLINKEMSFADAAVTYSDDPSSKDREGRNGQMMAGNKGDLGYFTVFNMIYPFEVAVYNTPVGKISMPVRTSFGYHIIYVTDKVPAIESISISQIYFADSLAKEGKMTAETKKKIDEVQKKLKNTSFEDLVMAYSDDKGTAIESKKGEVKAFAPQRRPGDFVKACISLKQGGVSAPVATHDGWFIIKLKEVKNLEITEDQKFAMKNRIQRDNRSFKSKESLVEKLKKEYKFEDSGAKAAIDFFSKNIPHEYMQSSKIDLEELDGIRQLKPMFTFADQKVTALDYAKYIRRFQGISNINDMKKFVEEKYPFFVNETILRYENEHLESKYPEFKALVEEYHDGMVLYEITSSEVWLKAVKDTVGLVNFYEKVKHKYPVSKSDPTPRPFEEVKSAVLTEYQDFLESKWLEALRVKYPVRVNEKVFDSILKK
ncbi:MAG: peptidylprolyl isomerase [Bacteroidales bacterium]|nr:peptidylprolyl isomerase [Bacteroidales bacterium]